MAMTQSGTLQLNKTAFELLAHFALRPQLYYDSIAEIKPRNVAPGKAATVTLYLPGEMAAATTPLGEATDITPVALSDGTINLTLAEYGNGVQTSALLGLTNYIEVNPIIANLLGFNAGLSVDTIARNAAQIGTNVRYAIGTGTLPAGRTNIAATNTLSGPDILIPVSQMRTANVQTFQDDCYRGFIHPHVSVDFRQGTTGNVWVDPKRYVDPSGIYNGVIGTYGSVKFMETPRAPLFTNVGNGAGAAGNFDSYGTLIIGREAFAKVTALGSNAGYGEQPTYVDAPQTDFLRRFNGMGWKHFVGYGVFRQEAIWRVESYSPQGNNLS